MLLTGILFANGRRTVTSWLRAAGVNDDFCDDDYFLARVGHKTHSIATPLVAMILRTLSLPDRLLLVITFRATYLPVGGVIRVVLIKEDHGWLAFFCLNGGLVAASKNRHLGRTSDDADRLANRIHDVIYHFGESGRRPFSPKVQNGWELIGILVPRRQYCNPPTALSTPLSALSPALCTQTALSEFFHPAALFAPRPP